MKENDFAVDTQPAGRSNFLQKNQVLIGLAVLLTFPGTLGLLSGPVFIFGKGFVKENLLPFAYSGMYNIAATVIFVELIRLLFNGRPFSKTLTNSMRIIGVVFILGAVIIPHLPGYTDSGFAILALSDNFTLIDGQLLAPGLLFLILANLIKAGFEMQREMDEIL